MHLFPNKIKVFFVFHSHVLTVSEGKLFDYRLNINNFERFLKYLKKEILFFVPGSEAGTVNVITKHIYTAAIFATVAEISL